MIRRRWLPLALLAATTTGCFKQVVETGLPAGTTVVDRAFVPTYLFGLVAAQPIDVRQSCPGGVAIIQTEQSFLNGLASVVTLGIFTPQHVRVTCATGSASVPAGAAPYHVGPELTADQQRDVVEQAVRAALDSGAPIVLRF